MNEKSVLYSVDRYVGLIVLNRPKAMNASSVQLRAELSEAMQSAEADDSVRVVVITGEGRAFSAGADLSESFRPRHPTVTEHILQDHKPLIETIVRSKKTYVAAVNGAVAGISVAYALACDLLIMAERAYVYCPFAAIGLIPDGGTSWFLLRALGYKRAYQLIVESGRLTSAECVAAGIANKVAPDESFRADALAWAKKLAIETAPLSLRYAKQALRAAEVSTLDRVIATEAELQHHCDTSNDFREGVEAFFEKRRPVFTGQ